MKRYLPFPQPFRSLLYVPFLLCLVACAPSFTKSSNAVLLHVDGQIQEDQEYVDMLTPYKVKLDAEMGQVIATGAKELKKNPGESTLGNLVADMQKAYSDRAFGYHIDISIVNNGGLRNSLPEGNITLGNVYELAPFENVIYILELTADDVKRIAEYAIKGRNLGIAGLYVEGSKEEGLKKFTIAGKEVESDKHYILAINDYLANGGDHMDFLIPVPRLVESGILLREMLLDQMREWTEAGRAIDAEIEGRQKLD
ncbi:MAG TPA: 5'-nucleotidase C-terminal domain-containing protein [Cyclobacteriaceae bacterium]|nr:5'-nucleotidase C-terminal domain-containing protein [Cyclobacteriaceae bacterium]